MPSKQGAGPLVELVAFDKRASVSDGYGNQVAGDFAEQFQRQAAFVHMRGSEAVIAARLQQRQPVIIRIRADDEALTITADWRARDTRRGTEFNLRTVTVDPSRAWIEILAESGVAPG